jgi:hypothetical protein
MPPGRALHLDSGSDWLDIGCAVRQEDDLMSQYVDTETGEIIDAAELPLMQARFLARQKKSQAGSNPQRLRRWVRSIPRLLWEKHYGEIMWALVFLAALLWIWQQPTLVAACAH